MESRTSLADALFKGAQQKVLRELFGNPEKSFYQKELERIIDAGPPVVRRELKRLLEAGLVTLESSGNQKLYRANAAAPIFEELCSIVRKTFGLAGEIRRALAPLAANVEVAFVYGSIAKRLDTSTSDIDLFVVSDALSYRDLLEELMPAEGRLRRKISPNLYGRAEFARHLAEGSSFVRRVLEQPKIMIIGSEHELQELGKSEENGQ